MIKVHLVRKMGAFPHLAPPQVHRHPAACPCDQCVRDENMRRHWLDEAERDEAAYLAERAAKRAQTPMTGQGRLKLLAEADRAARAAQAVIDDQRIAIRQARSQAVLAARLSAQAALENRRAAYEREVVAIKAPCYQCEAAVGQRCLSAQGAPRNPHTSRGAWRAWKYRPGTSETEVAELGRHGQAPAAVLALAAQPVLLPRQPTGRLSASPPIPFPRAPLDGLAPSIALEGDRR